MKLLSLASRLPFTLMLFFLMAFFFVNIKKTDAKKRKAREDFLEKERRANGTRRQSLDSVDFIVIPYDDLPMDVAVDDDMVKSCIHDIELMKNDKIANFTGITNTDLKLEYGAPNITQLSAFDANFTALCRILQDWGERLFELKEYEASLKVVEFAIRIRSDVSATYYLCAELYEHFDTKEKIARLKRTAQTLNSAMQPIICRKLDELYPDISDIDTV